MRIKVKIAGTSPLLMNRMSDSAAQQATSGKRRVSKATAVQPSPRDDAEMRVYRFGDEEDGKRTGKPFVPMTWLLMAWCFAARDFKIGKRQVSTSKGSLIPAAVAIEESQIALLPGKWEVDSRPVVIPATNGRILRHRPRFDIPWHLELTVGLDEEMIGASMLREIIDDSGKKWGIGDFRPQRGGWFGRYRVDDWTELKK